MVTDILIYLCIRSRWGSVKLTSQPESVTPCTIEIGLFWQCNGLERSRRAVMCACEAEVLSLNWVEAKAGGSGTP